MTTTGRASYGQPGGRRGRGGRTGNIVAYVLIGAFVSVCAVGWAIIMAYSEGTPGITPQVVSWQTAEHSVRVHYQISKPKGDDVRCAIVAYDAKQAELARVQVTVPPGTGSVDRHQTVATPTRAVSVTVNNCRRG